MIKKARTLLYFTLQALVSMCLAAAIVGSNTAAANAASTTHENKGTEPATLGSMDEQYAWVGDLGDRDALPGKALYSQHCAGCHEAQVYKAPHTTWLELMSPQVLYRSITEGIMQSQAAHLSGDEKQHIVEYITQMRLDDPNAVPNVAWCEGAAKDFTALDEDHLTGWGRDTRRYVSSELAGFNRGQITDLELKWSFGFPASTRARSQPTIAMGAVFVGSQDGTVYAFDLETGCVRWQFAARAEVRTGITLGKRGPEGIPTAYFGDIIANLYALDATTGELVWQTSPDDHHSATLTGTPAFANGNLYVPVSSLEVVTAANPEYTCCTFRGTRHGGQWRGWRGSCGTATRFPMHPSQQKIPKRGPRSLPLLGRPCGPARQSMLKEIC
jgi:polyvinyl alcohol dehydrogenase (cytochrome)